MSMGRSERLAISSIILATLLRLTTTETVSGTRISTSSDLFAGFAGMGFLWFRRDAMAIFLDEFHLICRPGVWQTCVQGVTK